MLMRGKRGSIRTKYISSLEKKIRRLIEENNALRRDNELLANELQSYADIKEQMQDMEEKYMQGIREAREISDQCKKMLATGKVAQNKYRKQMRNFLKILK